MGSTSILSKENLQEKIKKMSEFFEHFKFLENKEKESLLMKDRAVLEYIRGHSNISALLNGLDLNERLCLLEIIFLGQADAVFGRDEAILEDKEALYNLIEFLKRMENFYKPLGGIIGYHLVFCEMISLNKETSLVYKEPPYYQFREKKEKKRAQRDGIEGLPQFGEIYVLGGAADRLNFKDSHSGEVLPAALFPFQGISLLEGLIRDLQAKEFLYFKLHQKAIIIPLVLMTSESSHQKMIEFCQKNNWFGRSVHFFKFMVQPLVPLISSEGDWCVKKPLHLYTRPGGHGVLWQLAQDEGVFDWLQEQKRNCLIIRQINNPISGIDGNLLSFGGLGWRKKKAFGFMACERMQGAMEGVNVMIPHDENDSQRSYSITNLEYTNLPAKLAENRDKAFLANTNILFAEINAVRKAVAKRAFPGLVINLKTKVLTQKGEVSAGRLESLMQNIADNIQSEPFGKDYNPLADDLPTYIQSSERHKTIAVTKKEFKEGQGLLETPQGAYYAILKNYYDLLKNYCRMEIPEFPNEKDYLQNNWAFLAYLYPALGPQFEIIAQKIREGKITKGSTLELEIAELDLLNLQLQGSLRIIANTPFGSKNSQGLIQYSNHGGKCTLRNVKVINQGVSLNQMNQPWARQLEFLECLEIVLEDDGEFYAQDLTLKGNHHFFVPKGHRMKVSEHENELKVELQKTTTPSWWWNYAYDNEDNIILKKMAQA